MHNSSCFLVSALALAAALTVGANAASIPPPKPVKSDMTVGCYYFPGWCKVDRWYCIAASDTAQHPLLGYYREGDPDAADWHIKWALEHGISFFAFDYYTSGGSQMLEAALDDGFLKAKFIDRFKFCLNWCNHADGSTMTADEMERFGDIVIKKYLTHPSYMRINGKPLVILLAGHEFDKNMGIDGAKKAFDLFQQRCKDAGLPGVYLVFCEGAIMGKPDMTDSFTAGADLFCRYNYPYAGSKCGGPGKHEELSYAHLVEQGVNDWTFWRDATDGKFWPTVMPGWDRRPWTKDTDLVRTGSTPELFAESLRKARDYVNADKVVMLEAWNEWGEGSTLEPSVEHGFAYLDQVRKVFCPNAGPHKDLDPKSLGMRQPIFDLKLPSTDRWTFDFDTEGWSGGGVSVLTTVWGALAMTTTGEDPSLTGPLTYLDCRKYRTAHIRMRAMSSDKAAPDTAGQFFWSTIEMGMSGPPSIRFPVPLDGQWHDYDLDLRANPNWKGRTDRLRLDPTEKAGVKVEIDEIWLRP